MESVEVISRDQALERFRSLFRDLQTLPDDLGENPFPASVEATLRPGRESPEEVRRLVAAFEKAPGVEEVQYDLLWIERLATAIRLVRGVGALLGGHPRAGGHLHHIERDPPDGLRAPGRARHHAPGGRDPRVREGARSWSRA